MARLMPTREEAAELVPGRGSVTWHLAGDARLMLASGYALLLRSATRLSGRACRTLRLRERSLGPAAHCSTSPTSWSTAGRTRHGDGTARSRDAGPSRELRPTATATTPSKPEAYAWVHATLTEAIVTAHARFGRPMGPSRVAIFYEEWRRLGRLLGVRQRDLPETWPGFRAYVDEMVEERLEAQTRRAG